MTFNKDHYRTPLYVFRWLEARFAWFHFDGCATAKDSLRPEWIGASGRFADFLAKDLAEQLLDYVAETGECPLRIFVNPPYSDVTPFLKQAKTLREAGHFVVMLLNNDKSTQWYQKHVHNVANEVIDIVGGRVNFLHPITGEEVKGNSKGQMVVVFDPTMDDFVQRSVSLDFIKKVGGYGNK